MPTRPPQIDVAGIAPLLSVCDMPRAVRFYRDVLGFELVGTLPSMGPDRFHWCLLRLGDAEVMLNTTYEHDDRRPPVPEAARVAAHWDTSLYFGAPDVEAAYEALRASGAPVEPPVVAPYGMKQLSLRDPDGYNLVFQWPVDDGR